MRRNSLLPTATPPMLLCAALALTLTGCGKKGSAPAAAADAGDAGAPTITAQIPAGKDAATFAGKLVATTVENWEPVSGGEVKFTYDKLTFSPSGSWKAQATLEASFEKIPCAESGSWTIEEVESSDSAIMTWTIGKTGCPTRDAGGSLRVQMVLPKAGDWSINFR